MIPSKYIVWTDRSHSWIEVNKTELIHLGILDKISKYSYEKGDKIYLEEDVDAGIFLKNIKSKDYELDEIYEEVSRIRKYKPFTGGMQ
jgi:hypothetical protein|tara:strand:- start:11394 stop:11657 length:264 start_codon:yes stop_codon:yes gene_type:complete